MKRYGVTYTLDDDPRQLTVDVTIRDRYTKFEDIRKIIAVRRWGDPEAIERVSVVAVLLHP